MTAATWRSGLAAAFDDQTLDGLATVLVQLHGADPMAQVADRSR